jgi:predicted CXXCH cytochrome family protein
MTVMEFNLVSISLSLPRGSADLIEIKVNNKKKVSIVPRQKFECSSVALELGINEINITAKKEARIVDEAALYVFRSFHMKDHSRCAVCHHILEPREADKKPINIETFAAEISENKTVAPPESTCYSCHRGMTSYLFVHGPASVWSCLSCHDPQAEPKYILKYPNPELCYKCHIEKKQKRSIKKNFHAPFATSRCVICHNPHASENPFRLVKPTWLLCISCHTDKGSGRHIIAGYVYGNRHPTHGVLDPLRKGRELTCASCHNPHSSDSSKFIRLNAGRGFRLCGECHINNERRVLLPYQLP